MIRHIFLLVAALAAATTTLAHQGVENPVVIARMDGMSEIARDMKVIGDMAKGKAEFDAEAARSALTRIAKRASEAPDLFEEEADDPKSEALPSIWDNFDDFTTKAEELQGIALELEATISGPEDLRHGLKSLGANCKSCHAIYRE